MLRNAVSFSADGRHSDRWRRCDHIERVLRERDRAMDGRTDGRRAAIYDGGLNGRTRSASVHRIRLTSRASSHDDDRKHHKPRYERRKQAISSNQSQVYVIVKQATGVRGAIRHSSLPRTLHWLPILKRKKLTNPVLNHELVAIPLRKCFSMRR